MQVLITGWGTTASGGSTSDHLRAAVVGTHTRAQCAGVNPNIVTSHPVICAGGSVDGGRDTCQVREMVNKTLNDLIRSIGRLWRTHGDPPQLGPLRPLWRDVLRRWVRRLPRILRLPPRPERHQLDQGHRRKPVLLSRHPKRPKRNMECVILRLI